MTIEELKELQNQIIEKEKKYNLIGGITYLALIIPSIIMMIIWKSDYFSIIIFLMIISIIFDIIFFSIKSCATNKEKVKFNNEFKKIFVFNSLSKYFKELKYLPNGGISEYDIESYSTLDTADSFSSNDYVSGLYKDIKFEQSDVLIREREEETDSDGNTRTVWKTIFEGRYMIFDFNKEFKSNVKVVTKRFEANRFSWGKKMSNVKMEDVEFNKMFAIFAENDHEAFYILTPIFMEKMKNIYNKLKTPIMFCFLNNKLHIAIDNRDDSFEWNVLKPIDENKISEEITKDIELITNFVDDLDLNNDLFK